MHKSNRQRDLVDVCTRAIAPALSHLLVAAFLALPMPAPTWPSCRVRPKGRRSRSQAAPAQISRGRRPRCSEPGACNDEPAATAGEAMLSARRIPAMEDGRDGRCRTVRAAQRVAPAQAAPPDTNATGTAAWIPASGRHTLGVVDIAAAGGCNPRHSEAPRLKAGRAKPLYR